MGNQDPNVFIEAELQKVMESISPLKLCERYDKLKTKRSGIETKWNEIQRMVFPDMRDYSGLSHTSNAWGVGSSMQVRTGQTKTHSSMVSSEFNKFVSAFNSKLCDPSHKWFSLKFSDERLSKNGHAKAWLKLAEEGLYSLFGSPSSNFYSSNYSYYCDWGSIGTACREVIVRKDTGKIWFNVVPMTNIFVDIGGYGEISDVYRNVHLTYEQAKATFGQKAIDPMKEANALASTNKDEYEEYIIVSTQCSVPCIFYGKSLSITLKVKTKTIVDVEIHDFPTYIVSRFMVAPNEIYGRSFVWNLMPIIKKVDVLSRKLPNSMAYAIDPITLVSNTFALKQKQLIPGHIVQGLSADGRPQIQQMALNSQGIQPTMEYLQMLMREIQDGLLGADLYPSAEQSNMTATEINSREIRASNRLRPLLIRLEGEDLNPLIRKTLSLMIANNLTYAFPYEQAGIPPEIEIVKDLDIRFSGQMTKMQELQDIQNIDMFTSKVAQFSQIDQSSMDYLNIDGAIKKTGDVLSVSSDVVRSDDEIAQIREARAQAQAQQQAQAEQQAMMEAEISKSPEEREGDIVYR